MEQVVQKNLDGSLTILPDSISPELKYIREQQCASLGGVDVTNDSNMSITPEVINVTVCDITGTKAATHVAQMKNAVSAMVIDSEFDTQGEVTPSYLAAPGLKLSPPSGNVPSTGRFTVYGYAQYHFKNGGRYEYSISADKCTNNNFGWLSAGSYGTKTILLQCVAWGPGIYQTRLYMKIPGITATSNGVVIAE